MALELLRRLADVAVREASASTRSARLTDSLFGNRLARSASTRTRFVPAVARRWYFPRTPPLNYERSYSFRRSSPRLVADFFLILLSFLPRGAACAEDPSPVAPFAMGNEHKTRSHCKADHDLTAFLCRIVGIWKSDRERIEENGPCLLEIDAVLFRFAAAFRRSDSNVTQPSVAHQLRTRTRPAQALIDGTGGGSTRSRP